MFNIWHKHSVYKIKRFNLKIVFESKRRPCLACLDWLTDNFNYETNPKLPLNLQMPL